MNASRRGSQKLVLKVGLHRLDARRKPYVGDLGQSKVFSGYFSP